MGKIAAIAGTIILTSCYLFPFELVFLPGINTKLLMGCASLAILGTNLARKQGAGIDKDFMLLCLYALCVSFTTLLAVFYNNTRDYTYVSYIMSMLVWTGGAYTAVSVMKWVHGKVSVPLVAGYLMAVCVMQCLVAVAISRFPSVDSFFSSFCLGLSHMKNYMDEGRLYGIGCAFDVAGMRFAAVLIMMGFFFPRIVDKFRERPYAIVLYLLSFVVISVVGNMIARTTSVGLGFALLYVAYALKLHTFQVSAEARTLWKWVLLLVVGAVLLVVPLYHCDADFREDFRFAFEGFFSLFETGHWQTQSNDVLVTMYRFPESLKTWLVGDGYFFDTRLDPYYTGIEYKEYYMATDVGYVRFIYYSGIIGLCAFAFFMCKAAFNCMSKHPAYRSLFFLTLLLQFAIWFKVASDIYAVFALFLVVGSQADDEAETLLTADAEE